MKSDGKSKRWPSMSPSSSICLRYWIRKMKASKMKATTTDITTWWNRTQHSNENSRCLWNTKAQWQGPQPLTELISAIKVFYTQINLNAILASLGKYETSSTEKSLRFHLHNKTGGTFRSTGQPYTLDPLYPLCQRHSEGTAFSGVYKSQKIKQWKHKYSTSPTKIWQIQI